MDESSSFFFDQSIIISWMAIWFYYMKVYIHIYVCVGIFTLYMYEHIEIVYSYDERIVFNFVLGLLCYCLRTGFWELTNFELISLQIFLIYHFRDIFYVKGLKNYFSDSSSRHEFANILFIKKQLSFFSGIYGIFFHKMWNRSIILPI